MALVATWTDPVELNANDVLTATAMNEQVFQNMMYLREPNPPIIATQASNQNISAEQTWTSITNLVVNVSTPLGKCLVTVNIPYVFRNILQNTNRYARFAVLVNGANRQIIHTSTGGYLEEAWLTVSSTFFLTGLPTDSANTIRIQAYNDTPTNSSNNKILTVLGGSAYISQLAVQAIG